jgi:hypothetical protein
VSLGTGCGGGGTSSSPSAAILQSITITPSSLSLAKGLGQPLQATGHFSDMTLQDLTTTVTWASSSPAVATISPSGQLNTSGTGTATITAAFRAAKGSASITVTPAVLTALAVNTVNASIPLGLSAQFTATGTFSDSTTEDLTASVAWSSSNPAVATVNAGLAASVSVGSANISATSGSIANGAPLTVTAPALVSILVNPSLPSVPLGRTQQFSATGNYTDKSTKDISAAVTWASDNTGIATVTPTGVAQSVAVGSCNVSATLGSIAGEAGLKIAPAALVSLAITPANASTSLGLTQQFTATGTYTDGTSQTVTASVTWGSSAASIATIDATGLLQTKAPGSTNISAQLSGVNAPTVAFQVAAAALTSLVISPADPTLAKGLAQQFAASGSFTDGTNRDMTNTVTWSSTATSVATIQPSGLAQSLAVGQTSIAAQAPGLSGTVQANTGLTVGSAALRSLAISPSPGSVPLGSQLSFIATGTFTDNSTQDMTQSVTWNSANADIATISNSAGQNGVAPSAGIGSTTVGAASGAINSSAALSVTPGGNVTVSIATTWASTTRPPTMFCKVSRSPTATSPPLPTGTGMSTSARAPTQ